MASEPGASARLRASLAAGLACTAAWSELLDRINVFPVADGDTGRNLVVSLAPLRDEAADESALLERLLLSARGNSGNIACAFVRALIEPGEAVRLETRFALGAEQARHAVADPQPGTMLTVLDALAEGARAGLRREAVEALLDHLTQVVRDTTSAQESLRRSNVPDSGALGMLVFLDGMLRSLLGLPRASDAWTRSFESLVRFDRRSAAAHAAETGFCVDAVVRLPQGQRPTDQALAAIGSEVIALREGELCKIHLHAPDAEAARRALGALGEVVRWSWDDLHAQSLDIPMVGKVDQVHVVTDGAASLSRGEAQALGISLLDSYVDFGDRSLPETRVEPEDVYRVMRQGTRVSTAQASTFERHACYERLTAMFPEVLYLCVGSVYTGNHAVASAWRAAHALGNRMRVVDTGAASGKLAVIVRAAAQAANLGMAPSEIATLVQAALEGAEEYIFPERLEYLARGGRLSKTGAWFGDALHLGPVVSPMPDGARKVAMFRKLEDKIGFACDRVGQALAASHGQGFILVEHTDNRPWVESALVPRLNAAAPRATLVSGPLSLTTGVHTGPGTWGVAVLPALGPKATGRPQGA
jgi:DegV family protein with EDD domain